MTITHDYLTKTISIGDPWLPDRWALGNDGWHKVDDGPYTVSRFYNYVKEEWSNDDPSRTVAG